MRGSDRGASSWPLWLALCGLAPAVQAAPLYFSAPETGARVTAYRVELPVNRGERQGFEVPRQCAELLGHASRNAAQWGGLVDRNLWRKVEGDCRYHAMVHRHDHAPGRDFVSDYDFMNADLRDLPVTEGCPETSTCQGLGAMLAWASAGQEGMAPSACRVVNGGFRGWVAWGEGGLVCAADPRGAGFRIQSVDFADLDGDGQQDVLLRLAPVGPRLGRATLVLALTRREGEARFSSAERPSELGGLLVTPP